jgi:hypothetical protein
MPTVPLHLVAARLRPTTVPAHDEEDWDAVIAHAKMQAALPETPSLPPPPPRDEWADMPDTPPPLQARQALRLWIAKPKAPRAAGSEKTQATLDALVRGGLRKPVAPLPAFVARRPAEEDLPTPPPLGTARRAAGPPPGRAKRA